MNCYLKTLIILFLALLLCLPVLAKGSSKSKEKELKPVRIEFTSKDKFHIVGDLYLPQKLEKNTKIPLLIFLHEIIQDKEVWKPYAKDFVDKGYSVLSLDIRGHGESILNKKKEKSFWRKLSEEDWKNTPYDVTYGIDYLKQNYPQVNTDKILIIGASLGSCIAVKAAAEEKTKVKGLVLLSPFNNYKGIEARVPLVNYGANPILIIVSKADTTSYESAAELVKYSQGTHEIVLVKNAGHGITMLKFEPELKQIMYDWILKHLPPVKEPVPPAAKGSKKKSGQKH